MSVSEVKFKNAKPNQQKEMVEQLLLLKKTQSQLIKKHEELKKIQLELQNVISNVS